MKVNFLKRLGAYIIDIIIVGLILSLISYFIPENESLKNLSNELMELMNNTDISHSIFIHRLADISYNVDKISVLSNIITCIVAIIYFVIIPFYKNGQTIGKKIFKIKIVDSKGKVPTINELTFRNLIINGIGYEIIMLLVIFIVPSMPYVIIMSFLWTIQILLVIISAFMISYRKDRKGLHDLITKTEVIYEEVK